jgi:hypothetical protein
MKICKVPECGLKVVAHGLCNKHEIRLRKTGTTDDGPRARASIENRFWKKVHKTDCCWTWIGTRKPNQYGAIQSGGVGSKTLLAHRVSYEIHKGKIPVGMVVMHSCDNPSCVNPEHLSLGTFKENTADMIAKGRKVSVPIHGEKNGKSRLNLTQVEYIKGCDKTNAALARELNVSVNCIRSVRIGRTWKTTA